MNSRTIELLKGIGVSQREIRAASSEPIHDAPSKPEGYGLIGTTGSGKTWRLVQSLAKDLDERVVSSGCPESYNRPHRYAAWVNWPDAAESLKGMVGQHYALELSELVEKWEAVGMLFLDDLGAERITGENDYSLGILRKVLDSRYRAELPVFWTSNLNLKALSGIYGARLMSRVFQAWPPTVIRGNDLRLSQP